MPRRRREEPTLNAPAPRTRAGSIADQVRILIDASANGLTITEIKAALAQDGRGVHKKLTPIVGNMVARGVLVRLGGRFGHVRYGLPEKHSRDRGLDPDAESVLQALKHLTKTGAVPASTRHVRRAIRALDLPLTSDHPNLVKKRLETLSRHRKRGPAVYQSPLVERVLPPHPGMGPCAAYWVLAGQEPPPSAFAVRSVSQAFREAVLGACEALGRPVTRAEVRLWLALPTAPSSLTKALPARYLATIARNAIRGDAATETPGRIMEFGSRWSGYGGPAGQLGLRGTVTGELVAIRHAIQALRLPEELRSLQALARMTEMSDSEAGRKLLAARGAAIREALRDCYLDPVGLEGALDLIAQWVDACDLGRNRRGKWLRMIQAERDGLAAMAQLLALAAAMEAPAPLIFGQAGRTDATEIAPILDSFTTILDLGERPLGRQLARARRTPDRPLPALGSEGHRARFDRADAILSLYDSLSNTTAYGLVSNARVVMGEVLRDADVLRAVVEEAAHEGTEWLAEGAVVALGLLSEEPPSASVGLSVEARLLATWLAGGGGEIGRETSYGDTAEAWSTTQMAAARVESGYGAVLVG